MILLDINLHFILFLTFVCKLDFWVNSSSKGVTSVGNAFHHSFDERFSLQSYYCFSLFNDLFLILIELNWASLISLNVGIFIHVFHSSVEYLFICQWFSILNENFHKLLINFRHNSDFSLRKTELLLIFLRFNWKPFVWHKRLTFQ